jgi:hypothetical protein
LGDERKIGSSKGVLFSADAAARRPIVSGMKKKNYSLQTQLRGGKLSQVRKKKAKKKKLLLFSATQLRGGQLPQV